MTQSVAIGSFAQALRADGLQVVDATENSIESREAALKTLVDLGVPNTETTGLLVYVPAYAPVSDEDRQRDPFALYSVCGNVFPDGDGDEYLIPICIQMSINSPDFPGLLSKINT